ncbi:MAG: type III-A CRISPR-associated protein Csm2, partial [Ignavibacteria bacterium]
LSTSQIRNVYGEVMRLKMKGFNPDELVLLKPRLAYSTERKGTDGSKKFREVIEKALDKVIFTKEKQQEYFQNFANFFEAILAYHRSFGGK